MANKDLTIKLVSSGNPVYSPETVNSSYTVFSVTNNGTVDMVDIGLYISPATNLGAVDYPADEDIYTDYQDILTWGANTQLGETVSGGIKISCTDKNGDPYEGYITLSNGSKYENRILMLNLDVNESQEFSILMESPPLVPSRRFYVQVNVEGIEE